jgi:hypothetical protein
LSLIILEGLDRTGKSSVARHFESKGFEVIHASAPAKGMTVDLFLEEQLTIIARAASKDILLDRSYYGELVWPTVYGRPSLLTEEGLEALREMEGSVDTTRILMVDNNVDAHWKRCVDNNEPLTKPQFVRARQLFSQLADKHGFTRKSLSDFNIATDLIESPTETAVSPVVETPKSSNPSALTKEQVKLETANAINDILSKRILKSKGEIYDRLENSLRTYLNDELAKIFGTKTTNNNALTDEEVAYLKALVKRVKEKQ